MLRIYAGDNFLLTGYILYFFSLTIEKRLQSYSTFYSIICLEAFLEVYNVYRCGRGSIESLGAHVPHILYLLFIDSK